MLFNIYNMKLIKLHGEQFEVVATVILRIPGYFILDYWYQNDIHNCIPRSFVWSDIVSSGFAIYAVIQGLLILLLPFTQLVSFYMHYLTVAVLAAADTFSRYYIDAEKELVLQWPGYGTVSFQGFSNMLMLQKSLFDASNDIETLFLRQQVAAIVFHTLVASLITFFLDLESNKDKILLLVYLVPVFGRLAGCPVSDLQRTHNFASCFVIFLTVQYIFLCMPHVISFLKSVSLNAFEMVQWYGPLGIFWKLWARLFVPIQVFIFWIVIFASQVYTHLLPSDNKFFLFESENGVSKTALENSLSDIKILVNHLEGGANEEMSGAAFGFSARSESKADLIGDAWYVILIQSAAEVCHTPLTLGGACVAISFLAKYIILSVKWFIMGPSSFSLPEDLAVSGWSEGVTMALLAVQTSFLSLPIPERLAVLSIIILIVVSCIIQSVFELVEPLVLSISTQGLSPLSRHVRAWLVCLILLVLPIYVVYMFTIIFGHDFWLLIVTSTSIMTSIQVLGLMVTYIFLIWDSVSSDPWPTLDDFIYYTRATTRVFEFIVAVFVVGAGMKETLTGDWSWISVTVLFIHCYFNVWQRLQQGWESFLLRLKAAKRISALPKASVGQIEAYNDLCAICYSEMTNACVTPCSHLFHETCLRKWLYVQDVCPLCHQSIEIKERTEFPNTPTSNIEDEVGNNIPLPDIDEDD